jgi:uncharacterized membrane protein YgcG
MSAKRPSELTRRAALIRGTKLSMLAAFCATVGTTVIAACMEHGKGGGSGHGSGYGYGSDFPLPGGGYGGGYGDGYGYGF